MASQRIESMRLLRMEEREKVLQKIKIKRIKALRRLALKRDTVNPTLSEGTGKDIIDSYFNKGSDVYAPNQREGRLKAGKDQHFNVATRTAPLTHLENINDFESSLPGNMYTTNSEVTKIGTAGFGKSKGAGAVTEHRLTSAAQRAIRMTKKDIEEMHQILLQKKYAKTEDTNASLASRPSTVESSKTPSKSSSKKVRGRPNTPDHTSNRLSSSTDDDGYLLAVALLQRLVRGRAEQNVMFEGKMRKKELIRELKIAEMVTQKERLVKQSVAEKDAEHKAQREAILEESVINTIAGSATSSILLALAQEKERIESMKNLETLSKEYALERYHREATESGRRQKEDGN